MSNENYCPCCASDCIEFVQSEHFDNGMKERMQCNYCGSIFENEYKYVKQNVIQDNSEAMYMLKAKEVIETELKVLGDNINTSRGFVDGKVHFILDSLIGTLNDLDSEDLAKLYKTSSYQAEFEETMPKEETKVLTEDDHDYHVYLDELCSGASIVHDKLDELKEDLSLGMTAHFFLDKLVQAIDVDRKQFIEEFRNSKYNR